jgi:hypothetical protein
VPTFPHQSRHQSRPAHTHRCAEALRRRSAPRLVTAAHSSHIILSAPDPVPSSSAVPPHSIIEAREWRAQAGAQRSQMLPARPAAPRASRGALLTGPVCTQACPWQRRGRHGATRCATTCAHMRTSGQPVRLHSSRPAAFVHSAQGALVSACGRVQCSMCVCAGCSYHISRPGVKATTPALLPIDRDNGEQARTAATRLARERAANPLVANAERELGRVRVPLGVVLRGEEPGSHRQSTEGARPRLAQRRVRPPAALRIRVFRH